MYKVGLVLFGVLGVMFNAQAQPNLPNVGTKFFCQSKSSFALKLNPSPPSKGAVGNFELKIIYKLDYKERKNNSKSVTTEKLFMTSDNHPFMRNLLLNGGGGDSSFTREYKSTFGVGTYKDWLNYTDYDKQFKMFKGSYTNEYHYLLTHNTLIDYGFIEQGTCRIKL